MQQRNIYHSHSVAFLLKFVVSSTFSTMRLARAEPDVNVPKSHDILNDVRFPVLGFMRLCLPVQQVLAAVKPDRRCTNLQNAEDPVVREIFVDAERNISQNQQLRNTHTSFRQFKTQTYILSGCVWLADRVRRSLMYERAASTKRSSTAVIVDNVDYDAYDETPMPTASTTDIPALSKSLQQKPVPPVGSQQLVAFGNASVAQRKLKVVTKLFGRESKFGVHIRSCRTGRRLFVIGDTVNVWQGMRDMQAPTVLQTLKIGSGAFGSAGLATYNTRASQSDRHPSNLAAERLLVNSMPRKSRPDLLKLDCEVHKCFDIHTACARPVDEALTGMLRVALTLKLGSNTILFRNSLSAEIRETAKVYEGTAGLDAEVSLQLCCGGSACNYTWCSCEPIRVSTARPPILRSQPALTTDQRVSTKRVG